jgi:hypothetical protein
MKPNATIVCLSTTLLFATAAQAQFDLTWNAVACGGGVSAGGTLSLAMTIGQSDAWSMSSGTLQLAGGFWAGSTGPAPCYANCDGSTASPILNVNDFICFQSRYAAGDTYANCDGSSVPPILNVNDFICFQAKFAAGCP